MYMYNIALCVLPSYNESKTVSLFLLGDATTQQMVVIKWDLQIDVWIYLFVSRLSLNYPHSLLICRNLTWDWDELSTIQFKQLFNSYVWHLYSNKELAECWMEWAHLSTPKPSVSKPGNSHYYFHCVHPSLYKCLSLCSVTMQNNMALSVHTLAPVYAVATINVW